MQIKLTDTQIKVLKPLADAKNKADNDLTMAIVLITGNEVGNYSIHDGVLTIEEIPVDVSTTE